MIIFFGPTGAGKSVQGQMVSARHDWEWLSTGQLLRDSNDSAIIQILKSGDLVSDGVTYDVFHKAIQEAKRDGFKNVIIDGFPRTKAQAEWLSKYMDMNDEKIDLVIALEVPETELRKRLEKRGRMEDTPETIAKRMMIYRQKMYPVLGIFAEQGVRIVHIDGTGTVGEIHDRIQTELEASELA
ncbi:MAG: nucleoside monophosphate kinase [Patescibacteria group bacterium]